MGVVVGAARHYGSTISPQEFFCESGFAFALNIHFEICPSGPYCWSHVPVLDCLRNLGIAGSYMPAKGTSTETTPLQNVIRDGQLAVRDAVLSVEGLDHQIVSDFDTEKFNLELPWGPDVPATTTQVLYKELQDNNTSVFGFYRFDSCEIAPKHIRVLAGLECALSMYNNSDQFPLEGYSFGLDGYNTWITALRSGSYEKQGHWWNSMVWSECRKFASEYFSDWQFSVTDETRSLAGCYEEVADLIGKASNHEISDSEKIGLVTQASELEQHAPHLLGQVVKQLKEEFNVA